MASTREIGKASWSSDVCASDLPAACRYARAAQYRAQAWRHPRYRRRLRPIRLQHRLWHPLVRSERRRGVQTCALPICQRLVDTLGLRNIVLKHGDILDIGDDFGQFDYIIVYGIYS